MNKQEYRKYLLKLRDQLENREIFDKEIYNLFINSNLYKDSNDIFIFVNYKSEVNTKDIISYALNDNKNIYVPKTFIDKKEMIAVKINSLNDLVKDNYGILEPFNLSNTKEVFDIMIMPGAGFDLYGNRIGYGGGYYDKFIDKYNIEAIKIALAYSAQIVDFIEADEHDKKVDYIISEKKIIKTGGKYGL